MALMAMAVEQSMITISSALVLVVEVSVPLVLLQVLMALASVSAKCLTTQSPRRLPVVLAERVFFVAVYPRSFLYTVPSILKRLKMLKALVGTFPVLLPLIGLLSSPRKTLNSKG